MPTRVLHILIPLLFAGLIIGCRSGQPISQDHASQSFAAKPHRKDRNSKASHFSAKTSTNPKDSRKNFFSGKRSSATKSPSTGTAFSSKQRSAGKKSPSDAFSGRARKRKLKSADFFSASARSNSSGPVDDCFSSKVSGNKASVFARDPFSTKRTGTGHRKMGDAFSSSSSRPSLSVGDSFSTGPSGRGRGSFRGEKRKWLWLRLKRSFPAEKKYKGKDEFAPTKKSTAKQKEGRQGPPQLDLFRNAVWKKQ